MRGMHQPFRWLESFRPEMKKDMKVQFLDLDFHAVHRY